jgi:hypothetical protein
MWMGQNLAKNESRKNGFVTDPNNPKENPKHNPDFLGCGTALSSTGHFKVLLLSHDCAIVLLCYCTIVLLYYCAIVLLYNCTVALLFDFTLDLFFKRSLYYQVISIKSPLILLYLCACVLLNACTLVCMYACTLVCLCSCALVLSCSCVLVLSCYHALYASDRSSPVPYSSHVLGVRCSFGSTTIRTDAILLRCVVIGSTDPCHNNRIWCISPSVDIEGRERTGASLMSNRTSFLGCTSLSTSPRS